MILIDHASAQSLGELLSSFNGADPSKGLGDVVNFLWAIIKIALDLGGMFAVIMFLWGAWSYTMAMGSETATETAKKTLIWAVAGLALLATANASGLIPLFKK